MTVAFEPFSDLVFVYMPGCEACEEAMPEIDKFQAEHPRLMVVKIRADGPFVEKLIGKKIRATPTYVFRRAGQGFTHEGMLKSKDLDKWIGTIIAREEGDA